MYFVFVTSQRYQSDVMRVLQHSELTYYIFLISDDNNRPDEYEFNKMDIRYNIDRRSHEGLYKVIDHLPYNPKGRTGLMGRGKLGRWGPNHACDPVVTR